MGDRYGVMHRHRYSVRLSDVDWSGHLNGNVNWIGFSYFYRHVDRYGYINWRRYSVRSGHWDGLRHRNRMRYWVRVWH